MLKKTIKREYLSELISKRLIARLKTVKFAPNTVLAINLTASVNDQLRVMYPDARFIFLSLTDLNNWVIPIDNNDVDFIVADLSIVSDFDVEVFLLEVKRILHERGLVFCLTFDHRSKKYFHPHLKKSLRKNIVYDHALVHELHRVHGLFFKRVKAPLFKIPPDVIEGDSFFIANAIGLELAAESEEGEEIEELEELGEEDQEIEEEPEEEEEEPEEEEEEEKEEEEEEPEEEEEKEEGEEEPEEEEEEEKEEEEEEPEEEEEEEKEEEEEEPEEEEEEEKEEEEEEPEEEEEEEKEEEEEEPKEEEEEEKEEEEEEPEEEEGEEKEEEEEEPEEEEEHEEEEPEEEEGHEEEEHEEEEHEEEEHEEEEHEEGERQEEEHEEEERQEEEHEEEEREEEGHEEEEPEEEGHEEDERQEDERQEEEHQEEGREEEHDTAHEEEPEIEHEVEAKSDIVDYVKEHPTELTNIEQIIQQREQHASTVVASLERHLESSASILQKLQQGENLSHADKRSLKAYHDMHKDMLTTYTKHREVLSHFMAEHQKAIANNPALADNLRSVISQVKQLVDQNKKDLEKHADTIERVKNVLGS